MINVIMDIDESSGSSFEQPKGSLDKTTNEGIEPDLYKIIDNENSDKIVEFINNKILLASNEDLDLNNDFPLKNNFNIKQYLGDNLDQERDVQNLTSMLIQKFLNPDRLKLFYYANEIHQNTQEYNLGYAINEALEKDDIFDDIVVAKLGKQGLNIIGGLDNSGVPLKNLENVKLYIREVLRALISGDKKVKNAGITKIDSSNILQFFENRDMDWDMKESLIPNCLVEFNYKDFGYLYSFRNKGKDQYELERNGNWSLVEKIINNFVLFLESIIQSYYTKKYKENYSDETKKSIFNGIDEIYGNGDGRVELIEKYDNVINKAYNSPLILSEFKWSIDEISDDQKTDIIKSSLENMKKEKKILIENKFNNRGSVKGSLRELFKFNPDLDKELKVIFDEISGYDGEIIKELFNNKLVHLSDNNNYESNELKSFLENILLEDNNRNKLENKLGVDLKDITSFPENMWEILLTTAFNDESIVVENINEKGLFNGDDMKEKSNSLEIDINSNLNNNKYSEGIGKIIIDKVLEDDQIKTSEKFKMNYKHQELVDLKGNRLFLKSFGSPLYDYSIKEGQVDGRISPLKGGKKNLDELELILKDRKKNNNQEILDKIEVEDSKFDRENIELYHLKDSMNSHVNQYDLMIVLHDEKSDEYYNHFLRTNKDINVYNIGRNDYGLAQKKMVEFAIDMTNNILNRNGF